MQTKNNLLFIYCPTILGQGAPVIQETFQAKSATSIVARVFNRVDDVDVGERFRVCVDQGSGYKKMGGWAGSGVQVVTALRRWLLPTVFRRSSQ